ncbi:hypothetical protein QE152_g19702 [Popillia japonica]|uniref:Uncharacterized protein n=1 Tax=Popillia japonica TaxID=7064 RepID=A0AAW1KRB5_POPJA
MGVNVCVALIEELAHLCLKAGDKTVKLENAVVNKLRNAFTLVDEAVQVKIRKRVRGFYKNWAERWENRLGKRVIFLGFRLKQFWRRS